MKDDILSVESQRAALCKAVSNEYGIAEDMVETYLPPSMMDKKFDWRLMGKTTIADDQFAYFVEKIKQQNVIGLLGPFGISKTSSFLSLSHPRQVKENQFYTVFMTCNGKIEDPNYKTLRTDIKNLWKTKLIAIEHWVNTPASTIRDSLDNCESVASSYIAFDLFARVSLLWYLDKIYGDKLTPTIHRNVQFSNVGSKFIRNMYEYAKKVHVSSLRTISQQMWEDLGSHRIVYGLDEAQQGIDDFQYILSESAKSSIIDNIKEQQPSQTTSLTLPRMYQYGILKVIKSQLAGHCSMVVMSTELALQDMNFGGSGPDSFQNRDVVVINNFGVLNRKEIKSFLSNYPKICNDKNKSEYMMFSACDEWYYRIT